MPLNNVDLNDLEQRLRRHVQVLASSPRVPGTGQHAAARRYIREYLASAGYDVEEDTFPKTISQAGVPCRNLHTPPMQRLDRRPVVVIGAHYDSIPGSPGADDNASAVAALLEAARLLRPILDAHGQTPNQLHWIAFDLEEYGFLGSTRHCEQLRSAGVQVRGMISLEMLGYIDHRPGSQKLPPHLAGIYPDVGDFIGVVGNAASRALLQVVATAMKTVPGLPVEYLAVPGNGEALPPVRLSDHSSFWDRGYQALMITDTSFFRNPHYHQATDTPDTLDFPFLAKVTTGVGQAVLAMLDMPGPGKA